MSARRERVLAAYDAFNSRDVETFLRIFSPDVVWHPFFAGVEGEVYRGHDGVRAIVANLDSTWAGFRTEAEELTELGDSVLVLGRFTGTGHGSGIETAQPGAWLFRFEGDLVVQVRTFGDHEEARRAAGL